MTLQSANGATFYLAASREQYAGGTVAAASPAVSSRL